MLVRPLTTQELGNIFTIIDSKESSRALNKVVLARTAGPIYMIICSVIGSTYHVEKNEKIQYLLLVVETVTAQQLLAL